MPENMKVLEKPIKAQVGGRKILLILPYQYHIGGKIKNGKENFGLH